MRKIARLHYNYHQSASEDGANQDFMILEVGKEASLLTSWDTVQRTGAVVESINQDVRVGDYCGPTSFMVELSDGSATRIYNANQVFYAAEGAK